LRPLPTAVCLTNPTTDLVNWEDQVGLLASLADSCLRLAQSPPVNRGGEGLPYTLLHILKETIILFFYRWIFGFFYVLIVALPQDCLTEMAMVSVSWAFVAHNTTTLGLGILHYFDAC
jgi:hypothetical protein